VACRQARRAPRQAHAHPGGRSEDRGRRGHLPYSQEQIEGAPDGASDEISQETERALASHYGLAYSEKRSPTGLAEPPDRPAGSGPSGREQPSRSSGRSTPSTGQDGPTRDELYAEAKQLGIEGRSKMNKAELARAVERARGKSGDGRAKANPIEVQRFLEGVDYPTRKADLVREAQRQGADEAVRKTLERIRDEKFDSPADVSEAIGRLS